MKTIMKNIWKTIKTIVEYFFISSGVYWFMYDCVDILRSDAEIFGLIVLGLGVMKISMIWWKYIVLRWVAQMTEKTNG